MSPGFCEAVNLMGPLERSADHLNGCSYLLLRRRIDVR